jgi:hypothetical protein
MRSWLWRAAMAVASLTEARGVEMWDVGILDDVVVVDSGGGRGR